MEIDELTTYQRRPKEVLAVQFNVSNGKELADWITSSGHGYRAMFWEQAHHVTVEFGRLTWTLEPSGWVVWSQQDGFEMLPEWQFKKEYEEVQEDDVLPADTTPSIERLWQ